MLRIVTMLLLIVINYIFQSTVLQSIAIVGVTPDTALILIVGYGIMRGDIEGAIFGFVCGLMHDVFGGYYIGLYAMLGMLTGYISGKPFKDFFHDNYFLPFFAVVIATVCYQFLFYCCAFLFFGKIELAYYFKAIIIPKTIYTASVAIPVYSLIYALNARIERHERKRRSFL
jgi:rod shape-determining protein MreD